MPVRIGPFGGSGGSVFDDSTAPGGSAVRQIVSIDVRHGWIVDSIQAAYLLTDGRVFQAQMHGGTGSVLRERRVFQAQMHGGTGSVLREGRVFRAQMHGGTGGVLTTLNFAKGEMIIGVSLGHGQNVDRISFFTVLPNGVYRSYGPFGGEGGNTRNVAGRVLSFFGRSGALIDAIGFYVEN